MDVTKTVLKYVAVLVLAVAGGFLGSSLHQWIGADSDVVRAKRYEVIDPSGKVLSYWGPDGNPQLQEGTPKGVLLVFMDADGARRVQIGSGVGNYAPELLFYGRNGPPGSGTRGDSPEPRFRIGLGYNEDPFLTMRDRGARRIILGAVHGDAPGPQEDDWRLAFLSRTGAGAYVGTHGVNPKLSQAFVTVRDDKGRSWSVPIDFQYDIERIPLVPRSR